MSIPFLGETLSLDRCPHCTTATPTLEQMQTFSGRAPEGWECVWGVYRCTRCSACVLAYASTEDTPVQGYLPANQAVPADLPSKAAKFLEQAMATLHAPSACIMVAASSVDAMLKEKGLTSGSLYARIDEAAAAHLITSEMSAWAHEVRLDANDNRHADEAAEMPTLADAKRVVEFTTAIASFLFTLPARVSRGRKAAP